MVYNWNNWNELYVNVCVGNFAVENFCGLRITFFFVNVIEGLLKEIFKTVKRFY